MDTSVTRKKKITRFSGQLFLAYHLLCWWFITTSNVYAIEIQQLEVTSEQAEPFQATVPFLLEKDESRSVVVKPLDYQFYKLFDIEIDPWSEFLQYQQYIQRRAGRLELSNVEQLPRDRTLLIPVIVSFENNKHHLVNIYTFKDGAHSRKQVRLFGPMGATDTLDAIAIDYSEGRRIDYLLVMYAIYKQNPHAFYRNNMNNVRSNAMLVIPSVSELEAVDKQTAYQVIKEELDEWQQQKSGSQKDVNEAEMLLLKARLQRLSLNNDQLRQQRSDLHNKLREIEQKMDLVVAKVLEPENIESAQGDEQVKNSPPQKQVEKIAEVINEPEQVDRDSNFFLWFLVVIILASSAGGWFFRQEVMLWLRQKVIG
jgi:FimV-like protein